MKIKGVPPAGFRRKSRKNPLRHLHFWLRLGMLTISGHFRMPEG